MFRNPTADLLVVLLIVLLIFGPKRLPGLGKSLGHGIREFKDGITGNSKPDDDDRPELTAASATPAATTDRDASPTASSERRS
jgi:sec-independent protein translocase protein TatA